MLREEYKIVPNLTKVVVLKQPMRESKAAKPKILIDWRMTATNIPSAYLLLFACVMQALIRKF
jgi:hypothetical protein